MPAFSYRANLSTRSFPLVSISQGRNVLIPTFDNTINRYGYQEGERDVSTPQLYYGHNFMPVQGGFQSVDFETKCNPHPNNYTFNRAYFYVDEQAVIDLAITTTGRLLGRKYGETDWTIIAVLDDSSPGLDPSVSFATINGVTYMVHIEELGLAEKWIIDTVAYTTFSFTFTGAPTSNLIRGISAVNGYGVLWTEKGVFWSSSTDPLNYTPSLVTGAGGGALQQAKGKIRYIAPASFGAVVYTETNAIAMIYTGNTSYPFTFQEIKGAGGYVDTQLIASDANSIVQFAYTTHGFQSLSANQATGLLTDLTDFLSAGYYEDFDETTYTFSRIASTDPLGKKFTLIAGRYLVISYGTYSIPAVFNYAVIYDIELKRYGKIKLPHVDVYQWSSPLNPELEQIIGSIAFLQADGTVKVGRMFKDTATSGGVFLLGKYQYVRVRTLSMDTLWLENVYEGQELRVSSLVSLDGKNTTEVLATEVTAGSQGTQRQYAWDAATGINHSILICGPVDLSSLVMDFHTHGRL